MNYYVFDNGIGDDGFFASSTDRDEAIRTAYERVKQRESDVAIVVPGRDAVPSGNIIYKVRWTPGIGIEEPIKPGPGRPNERQGVYVHTAIDIREDLLSKLDQERGNKSRREYIEHLLEQ